MEQRDELILDGRTEETLRAQMAELAASYTPEWRFDQEQLDVGGTLAVIFANQMAGNLRRLNQTMDKYHTEFVNLLGISLLPAYPASGVVTASLIQDTIPGVALPRGTKLVGQGDGVDPIIFETVGDVYITGSRLTDVLSISGRFGKIIPLLGGPKPAVFLPGQRTAAGEEEAARELPPISLFDYREPGVEQNALLLYHASVFDTVEGASISVRLDAAHQQLAPEELADPKRFAWSYFDGEGLAPFQVSAAPDGSVCLKREGESVPVPLEGEHCHLICLQALQKVEENLELDQIRVASSCQDILPEFISHNDQDMERERFMPFGDTASLFDECYIGHRGIFGQGGATVCLHFQLSFRKKLVTFTPQQEAENLKIIKRKPKAVQIETASTSPQQVAIEYYNGIGWRRLVCKTDWSTLFDGSHPGQVTVAFRCPEDWKPITVSGYDTRCLRLRLIRADNCYLQPCVHTMPVMENLRLSYTYDGAWSSPQQVRTVWGTRVESMTRALREGRPIAAFRCLPYGENALYLGFDAPMEGSPVSVLFDVVEDTHFESTPIAFEYSSTSGWKHLKVIDHTRNLSCTGTVMFMAPSDFAPMEVEGVTRWWLRLVDERRVFDDQNRYHVCIRGIVPNAVEIRNVETLPEEAFYVRTVVPYMSFPLSAENILSASVFVSEKESLSQSAMQQLLHQRPEDVRVEYDFLGGIQSFFVRWTEVENFDQSQPDDRHYIIDRMNNRILFGDGVHVRIPPAQSGVAFTVQVQCCRGEKGNLPAGAVDALFDRILYIDRVSNPIATFAGSNIENITSAQRRGANIVSGRGRLVSELDYVREVKAFSDAIAKVKCVAGMDLQGHPAAGLVTVAVLMRDYADGSYAFHHMKERLRQRLLERSEATLDEKGLLVGEPAYVEISLDVWAATSDAQRSFDVQNQILDSINAFLDPLGRGGGQGWEIGRLPTEAQLRMMLRSLRGDIHIRRFVATGWYVDWQGAHVAALDSLPRNPFAIAVSGSHRIYMELSS